MTDHTVPAPADGAPPIVDVNERYLPLLAQTATALLAERCRELYGGVDDGRAPRHVADLLTDRLVEAIDARREVLVQCDLTDDHALSVATLLFVGQRAVERERERIRHEWESRSDDLRGLTDDTEILSELSDLVATIRRPA